MVWQVAHGDTPDNVRNNPALKGLDTSHGRTNGRIGTLVTKSLVIAGEPGFNTTANGAARCCARTTRRRAPMPALSIYRRRKPDRR